MHRFSFQSDIPQTSFIVRKTAVGVRVSALVGVERGNKVERRFVSVEVTPPKDDLVQGTPAISGFNKQSPPCISTCTIYLVIWRIYANELD